jgi:predicted 3-demethylubiquinone-9 3-methyltransferase (glyoxalase superfamily)
MQKITPFLWFNTQAEEAVAFYVSVFKDAKVLEVLRCGDAGPGPKGSALTVRFQLKGQEFVALNGGPHYPFTPAISFVVDCSTQEEVDYYWDKLSSSGREDQCGWLNDKYGVSWQVVPTVLIELLNGKDTARAGRVMAAMMQMVKLDIKRLQAA